MDGVYGIVERVAIDRAMLGSGLEHLMGVVEILVCNW